MSYGGPGCVERARRAEEIVRKRLEPLADEIDDLRIDLQGVDSLFGDRLPGGYPTEVRLRMAVRSVDARRGPRGRARDGAALLRSGRGRRATVSVVVPALGVTPAYVPRELVPARDRGDRVVKLRELAYSRSGDKGDVSNICVFVYDPADYPRLAEQLTAERGARALRRARRGRR